LKSENNLNRKNTCQSSRKIGSSISNPFSRKKTKPCRFLGPHPHSPQRQNPFAPARAKILAVHGGGHDARRGDPRRRRRLPPPAPPPLPRSPPGHLRRGFNAQGLRRSCATLALTAALFAAIFALPRDRARECAAPAVVANGVSDEGAVQYELRAEVGQLKLQLAWLGTSEVSCYLVLLCPFRANPVSVHSVIDSVSEFYVSG
jgi:hypothetical protein